MPFKIFYYPDKLIDDTYKKSLSELDKFFGFKWTKNQPKVFVMDNRLTMNKYNGYVDPDWVIGWISNNNVCLLDRKKFATDSCHQYSDDFYKNTIKHELVHSYTSVLSKDFTKPTWVWEGLAQYVSAGWEEYPIPTKFNNFLDFYSSHDNKDSDVYQESGYAIKLLVEKFGKKKLFTLIKNLPQASNKTKFNNIFNKIFGFTPTYKNFNDILNHQS